jgi:hypothetical protein
VDIHDAVGLTAERLERRIKAALVARQIGRVLELEDGWRQPLEPRVVGGGS